MIFVTGASGNLGVAVMEQLRHRSRSVVRVGARHPDSVPAAAGVEVVPCDFLDARTFPSAV